MNDAKKTINHLVERLQQIRDEVGVQIHLGKTEAKTEWEKLEKRRHALEAQARGLGEIQDGLHGRQIEHGAGRVARVDDDNRLDRHPGSLRLGQRCF